MLQPVQVVVLEAPAMVSLVEHHGGKILGELPALEREVITGTLPDVSHTQAM